jgi:hypothetical protein
VVSGFLATMQPGEQGGYFHDTRQLLFVKGLTMLLMALEEHISQRQRSSSNFVVSDVPPGRQIVFKVCEI